MRADEIQRRGLGRKRGQQRHQAACIEVCLNIEARFIGNALSRQRPAAHTLGIVAHSIALHADTLTAELPLVVHPLAQVEAEAVVLA